MLEDPFGYSEQEPIRSRLKAIGLWLALVLLGLCSLAYCAKATAETFSAKSSSGDEITLYEDACEIASPWFNDWHKAAFFYQGKQYAACWRTHSDAVVLIDSAGDISAVPMRAFKKVEAI